MYVPISPAFQGCPAFPAGQTAGLGSPVTSVTCSPPLGGLSVLLLGSQGKAGPPSRQATLHTFQAWEREVSRLRAWAHSTLMSGHSGSREVSLVLNFQSEHFDFKTVSQWLHRDFLYKYLFNHNHFSLSVLHIQTHFEIKVSLVPFSHLLQEKTSLNGAAVFKINYSNLSEHTDQCCRVQGQYKTGSFILVSRALLT